MYKQLILSIIAATVTLIISSIISFGIAALLGIAAMIVTANVQTSTGKMLSLILGAVGFSAIFFVPIISTLIVILITTRGSRKNFFIVLIAMALISMLNPFFLMVVKKSGRIFVQLIK